MKIKIALERTSSKDFVPGSSFFKWGIMIKLAMYIVCERQKI